jgi:hypothetical protein
LHQENDPTATTTAVFERRTQHRDARPLSLDA